MRRARWADFNGDGIGDIIVGAPGADADIGRAYVVYGNASGIGESFDLSDVENGDGVGLLLSGSSGGKFSHSIGYAVAAAGYVYRMYIITWEYSNQNQTWCINIGEYNVVWVHPWF